MLADAVDGALSAEEQQFTRFVGDAAWYRPITRDAILSWRVRGGVVFSPTVDIASQTGNFIPQEYRFYAGGPNDVRGYERNELGPVVYVVSKREVDEATVEAIRSVTKKPLRMDANEGWKTPEEAVRKINWLEKQGVEFIEQPMPAEMLEEARWVRSKVHIPVIADEACLRAKDIPKLRDSFDGINIKLDKCGGMLEAYRMIQIARSLGMKVMIGCMVSSSCTVTAAAQLSPLVDYADLDGNLLISNDPYTGVTVKNGKLILPNRPGLGLVRNAG